MLMSAVPWDITLQDHRSKSFKFNKKKVSYSHIPLEGSEYSYNSFGGGGLDDVRCGLWHALG
jgi:hypothetical protein